ncbi:MAG: branched-chain amino acid ABC transporter permease, partial [Acidimicrobiales bacterium]
APDGPTAAPDGAPRSDVTAGFVPAGGDTVWARLGRALPDQPLARHVVLAVAAGIALYFVTAHIGAYNDFDVAQIAVYVIAIAGLTVLTGGNGQISLGHGALMAVGAYTTALLMAHTPVPLGVEILAGGVIGAVFGLVIGPVAARLRGPYLAGVTLALALALPEVAVRWQSLFGGEQGIPVNPPTAPGTMAEEQWLSWICLIGALAVLVLLANLNRSRFGRAFRAVRDDEIAASLAGINVARTQVLAFVVSSACAGWAGSLLALGTAVVNPGGFTVALSIELLAGMVIGGTGSLVGACWGGLVLVLVPRWSTSLSNSLGLSTGVRSNLALVIFGAVLIAVMILAPSGIQGAVQRVLGLRRAPVKKLLDVRRPQGAAGDDAQAEGVSLLDRPTSRGGMHAK